MQRSLTANRLEHGAYRIASGEKWLALIGDDTDFTPKTPWARRNSEREPKLQGEWEKASELPFAARSQIDARRFRSFVHPVISTGRSNAFRETASELSTGAGSGMRRSGLRLHSVRLQLDDK